jgi:hypothetical protein
MFTEGREEGSKEGRILKDGKMVTFCRMVSAKKASSSASIPHITCAWAFRF